MDDLLHCTLHDSRRLRGILLALHGLAGLSLLLAQLAWTWQAPGLVLVALSAVRALRPAAPITLRGLADGSLLIKEAGDWQAAELQAGSLVHPGLCVLRLRVADKTRTLLILPDSLEPAALRRLRVWLRWRAAWPAPRWQWPRP
ncbi:MAG: protein YgfX [Pseudomonadota bacterium]